MKVWQCTVCRYIHRGEEPPEKCPVCGVDKSKFIEIDESMIPERPLRKAVEKPGDTGMQASPVPVAPASAGSAKAAPAPPKKQAPPPPKTGFEKKILKSDLDIKKVVLRAIFVPPDFVVAYAQDVTMHDNVGKVKK